MSEIRKFLGRLVGTFGTVFILATIYGFLSSDAARPKWSSAIATLTLGVILVFVGALLVSPPSLKQRPPYWGSAISGMVCSACTLLMSAGVFFISRTPREAIPRWVWIVMALSLVVGVISALVCVAAGLMGIIRTRSESRIVNVLPEKPI